jgi:hypothetical protein
MVALCCEQEVDPAVLPHLVGTLVEMFPDRLRWIAVGSSEATNESVVGKGLPRSNVTNGKSTSGLIRITTRCTEVVCAFGFRVEFDDGADCIPESGNSSLCPCPHHRLELGECVFNRVEVWTVGRQEQQRCSL